MMKFIFMGDPQCSRISGNVNDYPSWEELLRKSLELTGGGNSDPAGTAEKTLVVLSGDLVNKPGDSSEWKAFFWSL